MIVINNIEIDQEFEQLLFLGDIHGEWDRIRHFLKEHDFRNVIIFQVGDFGVGFKTFEKENRPLASLNLFLLKRNCQVIAIRGNHDNPVYFEKDPFQLSNIKFIPDYSIVSINLMGIIKKIFGIGGAISVDRCTRRLNYDWFMDEQMNCTSDMSILNKIKEIDIMISHNAPEFVPPFTLGSLVEENAKVDKFLKMDCMLERQKLGNMVDYIIGVNATLSHYFYGHFHRSEVSWFKDVRFQCLAIEEFKSFFI